MLILTRKRGEAIAIGDNIHIQVLNINGGQVRIGIDAPREVAIERDNRPQEQKPEVSVSTI